MPPHDPPRPAIIEPLGSGQGDSQFDEAPKAKLYIIPLDRDGHPIPGVDPIPMRPYEELFREIAARDPEHYPQGAETCFYCGAYLDTEPHRPDCAWVRAQQLAAHLPTEGTNDVTS